MSFDRKDKYPTSPHNPYKPSVGYLHGDCFSPKCGYFPYKSCKDNSPFAQSSPKSFQVEAEK